MNSATIKITYKYNKVLEQNMFFVEVVGAVKRGVQLATDPNIALWKALGTSDGLYAAGYSNNWQIGDKTIILQPSISDIEEMAKGEQ